MRIAVVVPGGMDRSGTERVIPGLVWLVKRLARSHDVEVFAMRGEAEADRWPLAGATVHNVGRGRSATLRTRAALLAAHRRKPFDVVHAFWASGPGVAAALARPAMRAPILLHVVGGDLVRDRAIGYGGRLHLRGRLGVALALRAATAAVAESGFVLEAAKALGHEPGRLPLGVDLEAWPPTEPRPRERSRPARLVHVGSLNPVKDQATLVQAVARLVAEGRDVRLEVAGEDTLAGELQALTARLGLGDRVRFHGFLPQGELRTVVRDADLMVLSSRHEGGPVAVLEAATQGVPTVGTEVGHVADWSRDAAVAVPVGDAAALARGAASLLDDDERRMRLAREAHRRALDRDAEWTAEQVEAIYRRLTRHGRGAA